MNPVLQALQAEAQRRGLGQPASNVGTQPNPSASQPVGNPLESRQNMGGGGSPAMPSADNPFAGGAQMMNNALPKGGTHLEKALIKRMMMYPPA